ncbi:AraC family transcriptional regulator [Cellulomonas carbonis]|uniref:AraC family transcriptional regulator n=1 Tax=Cellulomonas carbonis T26 TaxID=947969 RepID=A0A0A0BWP6_9CELL|nr:AraC family transcriptional regulator [Cellulomonas carbonis]KGM12395.1 AraC family transcriptional regulator [Cellulomonas carbonis T26]GGC03945.1 AraC family transcriptional regulator [Cellulomonas carbonis]
MDPLADFLDGPRARGAFLLRQVMTAPWSVDVRDGAPLTLGVVRRGGAWFVPRTGEPVRLGTGDVVVVRGPEHYRIADSPTRLPQVVIHPGQRCTTVDGHDVSTTMTHGVRTWGNDPDGDDELLVGTYETQGEVGRLLTDALPRTFRVPADDDVTSAAVALLAAELDRDAVGQSSVLDRLLDLLLVHVVRRWLTDLDPASGGASEGANGETGEHASAAGPTTTRGWIGAQSDPVAGPAVRLLHEHPARAWTVASLAHEVGASRALLARRFHERVGQPPMAYLTTWRLALAADRLTTGSETVAAVARDLGWSSPFTFSAAFKRRYGLSPQHYRTHATGAAAHA